MRLSDKNQVADQVRIRIDFYGYIHEFFDIDYNIEYVKVLWIHLSSSYFLVVMSAGVSHNAHIGFGFHLWQRTHHIYIYSIRISFIKMFNRTANTSHYNLLIVLPMKLCMRNLTWYACNNSKNIENPESRWFDWYVFAIFTYHFIK